MVECWDLDEIEMMEDDCLHFIRMLFIDLYLHKNMKMITFVILIFHVPLWSVQFYHFIKTLDGLFMMQYAPLSLLFVFAFISMIIPILYGNVLIDYLDIKDKTFWSLSVCSKALKKNILRKARHFIYIAKLNIIISVSVLLFLYIRAYAGQRREVIYQITYLKDNFPKQSSFLILIFYVTMSYFLIPMMLPVYVLSYSVLHTCFQVNMANERIQKITENFQNNIELPYDETYQTQVFKRFRFCIARLTELKSFSEVYLRMAAPVMVIYVTLAMLLVACIVGMWYFEPDKYYPSVLAFFITAALSGIVAVEIGQLVEDESMVSYRLLSELPWYTFGVKNQKLLLFGLIHASTPVEVSKYEKFPVNRGLIVQLYKLFSTLSALLANTKARISI